MPLRACKAAIINAPRILRAERPMTGCSGVREWLQFGFGTTGRSVPVPAVNHVGFAMDPAG